MVDEVFVDLTPTGPESGADTSDGEKKSPYVLIVSMKLDTKTIAAHRSMFGQESSYTWCLFP